MVYTNEPFLKNGGKTRARERVQPEGSRPTPEIFAQEHEKRPF